MKEWGRRFWTSLWIIELTSIIHDQFSVHICPEYWRPPHHALIFGEPPTIILGIL
jgi:hypothetical protein